MHNPEVTALLREAFQKIIADNRPNLDLRGPMAPTVDGAVALVYDLVQSTVQDVFLRPDGIDHVPDVTNTARVKMAFDRGVAMLPPSQRFYATKENPDV